MGEEPVGTPSKWASCEEDAPFLDTFLVGDDHVMSSDSEQERVRIVQKPSEDLDKLLYEDIPAWTQAGCRIQRVVKFSTVASLVFSHHGIVVLVSFPCESTLYLQIELLNEGIRHNVSKRNPIDTAFRLNWIEEKAVDLSPQVIQCAIEMVKSRHHTYLTWNCQVFADHVWGACAGEHRWHSRYWLERRLYEFFIRDSLVKKWQACKSASSRGLPPPRQPPRCLRVRHRLARNKGNKGPAAVTSLGDGLSSVARGLKCTMTAVGVASHSGSDTTVVPQ